MRRASAQQTSAATVFQDAVSLARSVIQNGGRTLAEGHHAAWTFLVRTPQLAEEGILRVLRDALGAERVQKKGIQLPSSRVTFNPDLVFDNGYAVGDMKYKLSSGDWDRGDLYQVIAFAEAFGAAPGAVVRFRGEGTTPVADALVGNQRIVEAAWAAIATVEPAAAARNLADQIAN